MSDEDGWQHVGRELCLWCALDRHDLCDPVRWHCVCTSAECWWRLALD